MNRRVTENPLNTLGNMSPLIFFDMIFDLDFGMISCIANNLLDPSVFDEKKFHNPVKQIIHDLYYREAKNPLVSFLLPDHKSESDEYYHDIMEEYHDEIVDCSMTTEIYRAIQAFLIQPDITVSILVKDEYEEKTWRDTIDDDPKLNRVGVYQYKSITNDMMPKFQQIFCKYPTDVLSFPNLVFQKSIYLANYKFNFESEGERASELGWLSIRNTINTIDLYKRSIIGGNEDDNDA